MIELGAILDTVIVGRVRPKIYAFSTNTVPNYMKVGDTYRPVSVRLREWRAHFPSLEPHFEGDATVADDVYFRDHSVHAFLQHDLDRARLLPVDLPEGEYYSREFFRGATAADVQSAIDDIHRDHADNLGRYAYFDTERRLPAIHRFERGDEWHLRPNQEAAVESYLKAVAAGRTNLLMYAVMRFGKTFASLMCAKRSNASTVLVVSAKADVKAEWKHTVESAGNFAGFEFLDADALLENEDAIVNARTEDGCVVVFLTLQDLQGAELKAKHEELFGNNIDLLIVDETHFGARAGSYGQVLRDAQQPADSDRAIADSEDDRVEMSSADEQLKVLHTRVRLHLSGSPYRILMGSEFAREDIIAFVQFTDIVREQEQWSVDHPDEPEWNNPYFGFPQMVRFAFHPNQSSRDKLDALRRRGITYAFSELLKPQSITKTRGGDHKRFVHEQEILDLLRVIDGSQEDMNLLGFLDNERIRAGQMCRHLVMVLPYKASCDAMQTLIEANVDAFKNLDAYEIINISGVDDPRMYPTPDVVKASIEKAEAEGRKTLTLTVNRMLTGSTVAQWDTMLYLKDTASPQEYDQSTFRLQSQHIRVLTSAQSDQIVKENLKPQTLLVDFDPMRLFRLQETRSLLSSLNTEGEPGTAGLRARLEEQLRASPVITVDSNRLREVTAVDIMQAVSEYNLSRSISDEARDIPVDLGLLSVDLIRKVIEAQPKLGDRAGLTVNSADGDEQDLGIDDEPDEESIGDGTPPPTPPPPLPTDVDETAALAPRLQTYYQRLLFFAMLTPNDVTSLQDIADVIDLAENTRIAQNVGVDPEVLAAMLQAADPFKLRALDYKILNVSRLSREASLTPVERASRALEKFTRLSESEVRTPQRLCNEIVGRIPGDRLRALVERGEKVLDFASKSGEFALAFYDRMVGELGVEPHVARKAICSLPTSPLAYEFTRRFYEILGLDVGNIAQPGTTYDLLRQEVDSEQLISSWFGGAAKFGAVVGNPPYQISDGGAQQSARPIYPEFIAAAKALEPEFLSFVVQSRWYAGGKHPLKEFRRVMLSDPHIRELHDFPYPETVFPDTNNRGGICFFLRDIGYDAIAEGGTDVLTRDGDDIEFESRRSLNTFGIGIFLRDSRGVAIVEKVTGSPRFVSFQAQVSGRKPFGLEGNIISTDEFSATVDGLTDPVICYGKAKEVGYVERDIVRSHTDWIDRWKVLTTYANNIGTELNDDNQNAFVVAPGSVCSETFIVMGAELSLTQQSAANLAAYLKTRFARFLHGNAKVSQHGTRSTYQFVPRVDLTPASDIDWEGSLDEIDDKLFDMFGLLDDERAYIRAAVKPMSS